ncbi:Relaxase/mobilization nuclease topoisomerase/primase fusion protein [Laribacter hongkongensis HLHK9]|uniref:Relaxase/mobilization nuclease topoisomerase/primase fusion protein n=1 Tax=Laribacter hongkongensis (strain HLHK9) TaxID=557598 RepID=C1D594_LARHH|nr:Relaxase/mobilization nuclease topoisomerase/primase fusion protein [Laribacter hongkongensis HLHK9]
MKAKVVRGAGFRGTLSYVLGKGEAELVAGTMAGADARQLAQEFGALRQLRPDIERPVWHTALSLPPGESFAPERWVTVARDFMNRMGFDDRHSWTCWQHHDTDYDHVHIVACRIGADGSVWLGRHDVRQAIRVTAELEAQHGLQSTKAYSPETANPQRQPTKAEIEQAIRTHEQPVRAQLQAALDHALTDRPGLLGLMGRLEAAGISVRVNMASTGRISGMSFEFQGVAFKGSDLGKHYSWNQLQQRIDYEQNRDNQAIAEHCTGCRGPDATVRNHNSSPRRDLGDSYQSNRDPARCNGGGPAPCGRATRPDDARADGGIQNFEDHNHRRQGRKNSPHRHPERVTGTGAVARNRLAELKTGHLEIQPRRRPGIRGAGRRLADMVAAWSAPTDADCNSGCSSAQRPNHLEMVTTTATQQNARIVEATPATVSAAKRDNGRER